MWRRHQWLAGECKISKQQEASFEGALYSTLNHHRPLYFPLRSISPSHFFLHRVQHLSHFSLRSALVYPRMRGEWTRSNSLTSRNAAATRINKTHNSDRLPPPHFASAPRLENDLNLVVSWNRCTGMSKRKRCARSSAILAMAPAAFLPIAYSSRSFSRLPDALGRELELESIAMRPGMHAAVFALCVSICLAVSWCVGVANAGRLPMRPFVGRGRGRQSERAR